MWGSCHTDRRFALEGLVVNAVCALWRAVMLPLVQHLKGCAEIWGRNVEEEHSRYRGARKQYLFRLQEIVAGERG